ncbi:LysE family translocator [Streptomyces netropsis]|uniref:RhtB (Resistance to homoserine/threonine) family protein n=1 Tax=Streptomyces netropsis TaxID=55404 RepID=A0A7W7LAH4_STRNE|nr:LysE family translocator [Streptomyces netropsis]MBB4886033.1 RhtB (resistance to homoserine/threonine) family protein [Streptomyces netropsis]GGR17106.1 lysine transporter LysE [Streptomyces netropsis]
MAELLAVALITVLAVISPGADFAMTVRNSYLYGRTPGLFSAVGISLGVLVHVTYTILGVGLLIAHTPSVFTVIKLVGAGYLVYIGIKTFVNRTQLDVDLSDGPVITSAQALRTGFLTNALNPKTTLFVLSTFTQVIHQDTPVWRQIGYGLFMSFAHLVWFGMAALFFSNDRLRTKMLRRQVVLNKVIGSVLVGLGVVLALTPSAT